MAPKEPTRAQLSSRLGYTATTPAFLQKFKNKMAGVADEEDEPTYVYDEYSGGGGKDEFGRDIVRPSSSRPAIPERPTDGPWARKPEDEEEEEEDYEGADEAPLVVVLKEGKHLTSEEVENEKRKAKGLPPLPSKSSPPPEQGTSSSKAEKKVAPKSKQSKNVFSSKGAKETQPKKRKAVGQDAGDEDAGKASVGKDEPKKKRKKETKNLLSFGDDQE